LETFQAICGHRSIRDYRSDSIPDEVLERVLHAATRASSSGTILLTFCADWHRMTRWCRLSDADPGYDNLLSFLVAFADALIAAQNAALAAEDAGLGICYMGTTLCNTEKLTAFFDLPEQVFPATTLVVGHPNEDPEPRARLPISGIVHQESYVRPSDDDIRSTYHSRETEGWNRYMSFPELADMIRESGVTNLAQIYTRLKYQRPNNVAFSREIMKGLQAQGFFNHTIRSDDE
jgi:nitroreductase